MSLVPALSPVPRVRPIPSHWWGQMATALVPGVCGQRLHLPRCAVGPAAGPQPVGRLCRAAPHQHRHRARDIGFRVHIWCVSFEVLSNV